MAAHFKTHGDSRVHLYHINTETLVSKPLRPPPNRRP